MTTVIDITIVAIVAFCAWRGYRNGLIRGIFGIVALVVALIIANLAAAAYSDEFTGMLNPFVSGVVDTTLADMFEEGVAEAAVPTVYTALRTDDEGAFSTAIEALRRIGLPDTAAENVAEMATSPDEDGFTVGGLLSDMLSNRLSSVFAYVAVFGIAFILLAIVFTVIGNLINLVFTIPGFQLLDSITGAVLGLAKGLFVVFTLAVIIRYIGLLAPEILEETTVLSFIVNVNPIAGILGI